MTAARLPASRPRRARRGRRAASTRGTWRLRPRRHPGDVRTGIARSARVAAAMDQQEAAERIGNFDRMTGNGPDEAATRIVEGIERRQKRILIGRDALRLDWMQRMLPVSYWALMKR